MGKHELAIQGTEQKWKVRLELKTEPDDFRDWLEEYLPSGWDIDPHGTRFPTDDGGYCILEPAEFEDKRSKKKYKVKIPGICWTDTIWTEQGSVYRSVSFASEAEEMIWLKIMRLAPGRVEATICCKHLAVKDYFIELLLAITERWPETIEQLQSAKIDSQAIREKLWDSLQKERDLQRSNLSELELQLAKFGIRKPLDLVNEHKDVKHRIEEIERELAQLGCD